MAAEPPIEGPAAGPTAQPEEASPRVRLARLALESALAVEGVAGAHAGPSGSRATFDRGERLPGVVATALAEGSYGLAIHLVTRLVPLHPLAEDVRSRVSGAAAAAGLAGALGPVDITIEDIAEAPSLEPAV